MPKRTDIESIMIVGSGPIVIGQACEFDYSGTQACKALREEGYRVILVNSNPATIMTDPEFSDATYIEPLIPEVLEKIIAKERPSALLPTLGGQTGLNLSLELAKRGILEQYGVELIGAKREAIEKGEDRELFKNAMIKIGLDVARSHRVNSLEKAREAAYDLGLFPLIIRPSYTLGGAGGGIAYNKEEYEAMIQRGLDISPVHEVLVEECLVGWKEYEMEVMRDCKDQCVVICSIENFDPMGVHTGDSITVAPAMTLTDKEYQMMRDASFACIREVGVETGGSNIQFAVNPKNGRMVVIEMNPRVSRSSALASKATGFPIAKIAAKLAVGYSLDELKNDITRETPTCFEPTIDYVVTKIPRFTFEKFPGADPILTSSMKSVGEAMAIGRTFQESLQKALRSLETRAWGFGGGGAFGDREPRELSEIKSRLSTPRAERIFYIRYAFLAGMTVDEIHQITAIDPWFLHQLKELVELENRLSTQSINSLDAPILRSAKEAGFTDTQIAHLVGSRRQKIRKLRESHGIFTTYRLVDTCAAEFDADTPYFYSCYEEENEAWHDPNTRKILVIGAGPIRIGQGVEFDYCSVHCVWALRDAGIKAIIVNNNPETVSTDFDTSDRLYFEPLVYEDVMNIIDEEQPEGVIVQFGGQTAINLVAALNRAGVKILGTSNDSIDRAEDRERFDLMVEKLGIPRPPGKTVFSVEEAVKAAEKIGYPVLLRPSYVLGGRAMEIVYNVDELRQYMQTAVNVNREHPVLVDKYLLGKEIEVDAVCDGLQVLIPGIMQHIERAGVHSGDSMAVFPAHDLSPAIKDKVVDYTLRLARELEVKGLINIQFVEFEDELYVLEVNPRSSRTVPFISKVTGIPLVKLGTEIMLGKSLEELAYKGGLQPEPEFYAIKVPVFSFNKLEQVDITLGPEMKSTGEVLGIDRSLKTAIYKGLLEAGVEISHIGTIVATIADKDKDEAIPILYELSQLGFKLVATEGTAMALRNNGIAVETVKKIKEGSPNIVDLIRQGRVDFVVNTLTHGRMPFTDGFQIRRAAVELNVPCLTSLDTLKVVKEVITEGEKTAAMGIMSLQEYVKMNKPQS